MSRLRVEIDKKSLKYVYFQLSEIESFTEQFMKQLQGVEFFNANEVGLKQVDGISLSSMQKFWGGLNEIRRLEANAFSGSRNLQAIFLKFNQIQWIHETAFNGLYYLFQLDLSSNKLASLTSFLDPLINLIRLDISSNLIERLPPNIFRSLSNLRDLKLMNNKLIFLDPLSFNPLSNLEALNISFNKSPFTIINGTFLEKSNKLKEILLIGDKIKAIDRRFFENLRSSINFISFRDNFCIDLDLTMSTNKTLSRDQEIQLETCFKKFDELSIN